MPLYFHTDRRAMFEQQFLNARDHIIPFVGGSSLVGAKVLDVGTGDGGVMKAFIEAGATGVGVDLSETRIEFARAALQQECDSGVLQFVSGDIHDPSVSRDWEGAFDLVVLKDAIEHIPEKHALLRRIGTFLRPGGSVFLGFPPWRMPFGGHQQISRSKIAQIPYSHLLPGAVYRRILHSLGEREKVIAELMSIRETRLSISGFERLVKESGFEIEKRQLFLINPIYKFKFGLRPRPQIGFVAAIPGLRDFVTTTCYYLLRQSNDYER